MRGEGRAHGAVTFLNALFSGVGAAAGVDLTVRAEVHLDSAATEGVEFTTGDSPLTRAMVTASLERWGPGGPVRGRVALSSGVPPAVGLKSSSAVASALALAVAAAGGRHPSAEEVARLGADVSQRVGLSATGAFDDGLAGLRPGVHVTDNASRSVLRTDPIDPSLRAVVLVPSRTHPPSPELLTRLRRLSPEAGPAESAVREGDYLSAMEQNSRLVERALGYEYAQLRSALRDAGALASGVSGMGPALVSIAPEAKTEEVRRILSAQPGAVVICRFLGDRTDLSSAAERAT